MPTYWEVRITPASGVGGEWPRGLRHRTLKQARLYAEACRRLGQKARIIKITSKEISE